MHIARKGAEVVVFKPPDLRVSASLREFNASLRSTDTGNILFALFAVAALVAACGSGGISGRVTDADGDPLAGVEVRLEVCTQVGCETVYNESTSAEGDYAFEGVELGSYTLAIEWADVTSCSGAPMTTGEGFLVSTLTDDAGRNLVRGMREIDYVSREQSIRADLEFSCQ
jgi:hypothetical protein